MTCEAINRFVRLSGETVMSTGPRTYRRFVASAAFCDRTEVVEVSFVPALDTPYCPVRFACVVPLFEADV
jgi:hypothetical protein